MRVFTLLPDLKLNNIHVVVQVRVLRKWEFRGPRETGPVQHVDMVLANEEANAIYAEIPNAYIAEKSPQIQVDKVYEISRFKVLPSKTLFRPVDAKFMIKFTPYTEIRIVKNPPSTFPNYVYRLTPFDRIEDYVNKNEHFLDVLGVITQVNPLKLPSDTATSVIRELIIKDSSDSSLKITLWGNQARNFSLHNVYNTEDVKPIIILFVGCLAKRFQGSTYLSGTTACHWYINPDIPEAANYYSRLQDQRFELQLPTPAEEQIELQHPPELEHKSLKDLKEIHPFVFPASKYKCTVTITRLPSNNKWWFASCDACNTSCSRQSTAYQCSLCGCTRFNFRIKENLQPPKLMNPTLDHHQKD